MSLRSCMFTTGMLLALIWNTDCPRDYRGAVYAADDTPSTPTPREPTTEAQLERAITYYEMHARYAEWQGQIHAALYYRTFHVHFLRVRYPVSHWRVVQGMQQKADIFALVELWRNDATRVLELFILERDAYNLAARQRVPQALPHARRVVELTEELLGRMSHRYLVNVSRLALAYGYIDRSDIAVGLVCKRIVAARTLYGSTHPVYGDALKQLGDLLVKSGDIDRAMQKYTAATRIYRENTPGSGRHVAVKIGMATAYRMQGDNCNCVNTLELAQEILEGEQFEGSKKFRKVLEYRLHVERGELVTTMRSPLDSVQHYQRAIAALKATGDVADTESTDFFRTLADLGSRLALSDDPERRAEGLEHLQRALDEFERRYGREGLFYSQTLGHRAQVHAYWEEWDEAAELFEHSLRVMKEHDVEQSLRYKEFEKDYERVLRINENTDTSECGEPATKDGTGTSIFGGTGEESGHGENGVNWGIGRGQD